MIKFDRFFTINLRGLTL